MGLGGDLPGEHGLERDAQVLSDVPQCEKAVTCLKGTTRASGKLGAGIRGAAPGHGVDSDGSSLAPQ